jgi:hypothetical protein
LDERGKKAYDAVLSVANPSAGPVGRPRYGFTSRESTCAGFRSDGVDGVAILVTAREHDQRRVVAS